MKITFVSNYINHHQIPLAEELYAVLGGEYRFIQTEEMETERIQMGWDSHTESLPYLLKYYEKPEESKKLIADSDVVVFGGTDDESYITKRLEAHKPVIRCSERLYRNGQWKAVSPRGLRKKYLDHTRYRKSPVYLLCAGAYVPSDFHIVRAYPKKMFRWGYFPPFVKQDMDSLMEEKRKKRVPRILWSGRLLELKHPEAALAAAAFLKKEGFSFELVLVGGGEMEQTLQEQIRQEQLEDVVQLKGFLRPEEVRRQMEQADIFLFTSDYREGWGAVVNEAMNSGCAVVANVAAGACPYLIEHGQNGLLYQNKHREELFAHVKRLLQKQELREQLGRNAYKTIADFWNAGHACEVLLLLCRKLLGEEELAAPSYGPGSLAPVIAPRRMYRALVKKKETMQEEGR